MLPFLNSKKMSASIMASVTPKGEIKDEGMEGEEDAGLVSACEDIMAAMAAKDAVGMAKALRMAMEMCESQSGS